MKAWIAAAMPHLVIAPILLPMLTAALMLLLGEKRRNAKAALNLLSCALGLLVAAALLAWVDAQPGPLAYGVYLPSNWPVPYGIVLVADRLSALLLLLAGAIGLAAALFALARWQRAGVHFHPLFQIQLMGLNGAFLTGDLFNLFVFFEVMLVASYGLLLHGSGRARVSAGLHCIAINLLASSLFLLGAALLYGITGTLNMADMAHKLAQIPVADRGLMHAGAALLGLAFLTKAAMWPLNFWLVPAYSAASAPVAALFAIMTKVGLYAVLRLWTLFFPADMGPDGVGTMPFGGQVLVWGGLATLVFGALGALASQHPGRLTGHAIIVSAGTLLAAVGMRQSAVTGGALFYLLSSTLAAGALFLLVELIERSRDVEDEAMRTAPEDDHLLDLPGAVPEGVNLDDEEQALIGQAIPAAMAFLGLSFIVCTLLVTGLPPLSGFVAKFALLSALLNPAGLGASAAASPGLAGWALLALLIGSGLASTIALSRIGIRYFWAPQQRVAPRLRVIECLPILLLLSACALLTWRAGPVLRYADAAAAALHRPAAYIEAVLSARPVPPPVPPTRQGPPP